MPSLRSSAMDSRSAPERIDQAHFSDQLAYFKRDLWSADATSQLPSPEQSKTGSMPTDDGLWLDCVEKYGR
jgi:hypothetical protein